MGYGIFGIIDTLFPLLFGVVFLTLMCVMIAMLIRGVSQWSTNNSSPVLSVEAKVVSKRTNVSRHVNQTDHMSGTSTVYYATFQVESGDRMELRVSGREFGLLAEGDKGKLTFQGTRYRGFERRLI